MIAVDPCPPRELITPQWIVLEEPICELMPTAVHECGHAVVSLALSVPVTHASVFPSCAGGEGLCWFRNTTPEETILIMLAGGEAQRRYAPAGIRVFESFDLEKARRLLGDIHESAPDSAAVTFALDVWRRRARRHVDEHWRWILNSAEQLARWRRLSGTEILSLWRP